MSTVEFVPESNGATDMLKWPSEIQASYNITIFSKLSASSHVRRTVTITGPSTSFSVFHFSKSCHECHSFTKKIIPTKVSSDHHFDFQIQRLLPTITELLMSNHVMLVHILVTSFIFNPPPPSIFINFHFDPVL
jgi:hypothetical protein